MKKIYDHREFTWGLVGIALAAVCGGIMVLRGSSLKLAVIMVLMLALGWANIAQSTKRQMYKAVVLWDERRTTIDAHQILFNAGKNAKKRKKVVDAVAASLILEGYLTYKKSHG